MSCVGFTAKQQEYYDLGCIARVNGMSKTSFKDKSFALKHFWLAGWNDKDVELSTCG